MNVIHETDTRDGCQPHQELGIGKSKESCPNPYTRQEDDAAPQKGDTRMRTYKVGLINDIALIGNLKIYNTTISDINKNS